MAFTVSPADDNDIRKIVPIMFKAYEGKNEYINAVFPRGLSEDGEEITIQRFLFVKNIAKAVRWEKVVDTANGKTIGGAMWIFHEESLPQTVDLDGPPGTWENETNKEYAQALFRSVVKDERKYYEEHGLPLLRLAIMVVDPEHQRKGAGAALIKSGLALADSSNAITTLVATPAGKGLYEKFGFETLCERDLDVPEKFSDRPKYRIWTMARGRKVKN